MKALYLWLEKLWAQYLLGPDWSPFVVLSDWLKSECSYCHFWRGMFLGTGFGLFVAGHFWLGFIIVAVPFVLAELEESYSKR